MRIASECGAAFSAFFKNLCFQNRDSSKKQVYNKYEFVWLKHSYAMKIIREEDMTAMEIYEHKVQYYETDQMGIVHHSNYIRWFEEARTYVLDELGFGYKKMEESGVISPVLSVDARYKTMTRYGDTVQIDTRITEYNGIKLALSYTISDKETKEVRCVGRSSHCFLNKAGRPVSLKRSFPDIHTIFEHALAEQYPDGSSSVINNL